MYDYLARVIPDEWRNRRLVWRAYTLVWPNIAAAAQRQPKAVNVEEDWLPLFALGHYQEVAVPANWGPLTSNHGLSIELAGRQISTGQVSWEQLAFDVSALPRLVLTQPPILYAGDPIAVELSNDGGVAVNAYLTFHGVAALQ